MSPDQISTELRNNESTITGLKNRIELTQEEIDALTKRNAALRKLAAQAAPEAKKVTT
jgi:hypothetical protein